MNEKRFYVYEWYIVDKNEIFYVGKGTKNRKTEIHNRNQYFKNVYNKYICEVRVIQDNLTNQEACQKEIARIAELRLIDQAYCNLTNGGDGFSTGALNPAVKNPKIGEKNPFYGKHHTKETKQLISKNRLGKGGREGEKNPMYGDHRFEGENNPMYGKTGFEHPNSKMYLVEYLDNKQEYLGAKECEQKFGIAYERIRHDLIGIIQYKKKSKNSHYAGTKITRVK